MLAVKTLNSNKKRFLPIFLIIAVCIAAIMSFAGFHKAVKTNLAEKSARSSPLGQIRIYPKSSLINITKFGSNASNLTPELIEKIASMPEIEKTYREISYHAPVALETSIFGQTFVTDSLMFGVEKELIAEDLAPEYEEKWDATILSNFSNHPPKTSSDTNNSLNYQQKSSENELADSQKNFSQSPIPIILPRQIVDLYNFSVAPGYGLPPIEAAGFIGKKIDIYLKYSVGFNGPDNLPEEKLEGVVAGFSDLVSLPGISIPLDVVLTLNNETRETGAASLVIAEVKNPEFITQTAKKIEKLDMPAGQAGHAYQQAGLRTDYLQKKIAKISEQLEILQFTIAFVASLIMIITLLAVFSAFSALAHERRQEFGILMILGATKSTIARLILGEALIIGILASAAGLLLATTFFKIFNSALNKNNPQLISYLLPDMKIDSEIALLGITFGTILSLLCALPSSIKIASSEAAQLIKK